MQTESVSDFPNIYEIFRFFFQTKFSPPQLKTFSGVFFFFFFKLDLHDGQPAQKNKYGQYSYNINIVFLLYIIQ